MEDEDFEEQKQDAVDNMVQALGCRAQDVFCMKNYIVKGQRESLDLTEKAACEILLAAMQRADEFVAEQCRKQQQKWEEVFKAQLQKPADFVQHLTTGKMLILKVIDNTDIKFDI